MDTKTPPIPVKYQEKKSQTKNADKSEVSLPPLTPLPNGNSRTKIKNPSVPWTRGPPQVGKSQDNLKKRPYKILHIGATPLMHACQQGDRSRVLRLLQEQSETIAYRDRTLRNALHYCMDAATGGAVASAAPELVNAADAEGHTPLHLAVIAGDTQLVAVLLANGADVNAKDLEDHSVLHWATVCGEAECVRLVLAAGAKPSTPDLRGGSPLHYAAQCCGAAVTAELSVPKKIGLKVLQTLLEFGADVNAKDEDGRQPILWAASAGSVEAVLALARTGGSAAAGATDKDGLTALHCAASRGHARCVEALVNLCGAQPDHVDDNGCSALHYAATLGHADATALLLRLGADPNRQDRKGRTPALCAAAKGQLETLKILAQHGGSLYARTVRGTGVAHEAVLSGRIELIEWLARKKPSTLDISTHDGRTPLHVAALHGHLDVCKVLLDNGARINAIFKTSKSGPMTPLDAALYRGHRDCAKLIQMHGGMTAHHLRTYRTAPNRVFGAKLKIKRRASSSGSDNNSEIQDHDVYIEEHWIERRTRRRTSPSGRRYKDRRDSRSFSEEEVRLSKSSRKDRQRRARSESARYDNFGLLSEQKREKKKCYNKMKQSKHEYGESSSELDDNDISEGLVEEKLRRTRRRRRRGRSGSHEKERSLSDDSLEVVVVRRSLEKKLEKIQYSNVERKGKIPREMSTETKITEKQTKKKSSNNKSKGRSSKSNTQADDNNVSNFGDKVTSRDSASDISTEKSTNVSVNKESIEKEKNKYERRFKENTTDSTSQENVARVTVTALVHKDQPPDTPKSLVSLDVSKYNENLKIMNDKIKIDVDDTLEIADEMQNTLMTKAADLKKEFNEIHRQMSNENLKEQGEDNINNMKKSESESERTTGDSQSEILRFQSHQGSESGQSTTIKNIENNNDARSQEQHIKNINDEEKKNENDDNLSSARDGDLKSLETQQTKQLSNDQSSSQMIKSDTSKSTSAMSTPISPKTEEFIDNEKELKEIQKLNASTPEESSQDESTAKSLDNNVEVKLNQDSSMTIGIQDMRHIDSTSSGSVKSTKAHDAQLSKSSKSIGMDKRSQKTDSKSPSKYSLFESSGERSPGQSAILAVIESPEWDEEDEEVAKEIRDVVGDNMEPETDPDDDDDSLGVLRVLPSTSEEETPRRSRKFLRPSKTGDMLPCVNQKTISSPRGLRPQTKQRRDSGGRDSGIEPSPRVSKIPKKTLKYCPNTEKHQTLNIDTVTRDVQISLRRYHLERKIFFQLMELKRLQIRHGRANEQVLVKRQVDAFHKAGLSGPALGVARYENQYTFRDFEAFLYDQLRRLQRRPPTPDWCTEAKQCTQKTHRCHHATSAYTSIPIYTYLGGRGHEQNDGTLFPRIENRGRGQMTVEVTRGEEKQIIALPAEKLDRTKRYFVTFTVRGDSHGESDIIKTSQKAQRNTKSV